MFLKLINHWAASTGLVVGAVDHRLGPVQLPGDPGVQHEQDALQSTTVVQWQSAGWGGRLCLTGSNGSIRPYRSSGTIHGGPSRFPMTRSTSQPGRGYGYGQAFYMVL